MNNKALLTLIAVILFGIFAVVAIDAFDKSPSEQFADDVSHLTNQISDRISHSTDGQVSYERIIFVASGCTDSRDFIDLFDVLKKGPLICGPFSVELINAL